MLQELQIRNYAIISELTIRFEKGLNIMTGETGAGKSIIMGALGLVLGNRADSSVLHAAGDKCIVEAIFLPNTNSRLKSFFEEEDIDSEEQLIIRREVSPNGKSRGFINDTPVNLVQMKKLASQLVDLHQQFDTLELNDSDFQREVLDVVAGNEKTLDQYRKFFAEWQKKRRSLEDLKEGQRAALAEKDYKQFLLDELLEASFKPNELESLEEEQHQLEHAEESRQMVMGAVYKLSESEEPIVQHLKAIAQQLSPGKIRHKGLEMLGDRLKTVQIELADIAEDLQMLAEGLHMDPERLQLVQQRIDTGHKLMIKHQVNNTAGLLAIQKKLGDELDEQLLADSRIDILEKQIGELEASLRNLGFAIREKREKEAGLLAADITGILHKVGMPNAQVIIEVRHRQEPQSDGFDDVVFLFDANKAGKMEPIAKVASGGELSRLMLAIKSVVAGSLQLPTLIFDEIDSGISGEAARQVGIILKALSIHHQLICITHQPQIAARAGSHFYIYKDMENDKIETRVKRLSSMERIETIAAMLGGETKSEATLKAAREMIAG